ncbi:MAG: response regulator transcription factor [Thermaerobacter sp.]|nr:response regulator transcription factor [Thermaerobacter sp.]
MTLRVALLTESKIVASGLERSLTEQSMLDIEAIRWNLEYVSDELIKPSQRQVDCVVIYSDVIARLEGMQLEDRLDSVPIIVILDEPSREQLLRIMAWNPRVVLTRHAAEEVLTVAAYLATVSDVFVMAAPVLNGWMELLARTEKPYDLTTREYEVLRFLNYGLSDARIAERLYLSVHTVKQHVSHVLQKLQVANRYDAATVARREGLVPDVTLERELVPRQKLRGRQ